MANLKDLIKTEKDKTTTIRGVEIPIAFTMQTLEYVADAFGASFNQFERDLNVMMQRKQVQMGVKELKLLNALIYGVVRTGGTETTPGELANAIPFNDFNKIVEDVMGLFNDSYFEESDLKKLKDNGSKK